MSNWIRLDVNYDRTKWLLFEKRFVKDAWPNLLIHVKRESPRKGRIEFRDVEELAYALRYDVEDFWVIARLIEVATQDLDGKGPAVTIGDGYLQIVNWKTYQESDSAERVRRLRALQGEQGQNCNVTNPPSNVTGANVTLHPVACDTDHRQELNTPPPAPAPEEAQRKPNSEAEVIEFFLGNDSTAEAATRFWNHQEGIGWKQGAHPIHRWQPVARNWIQRDRIERESAPRPSGPSRASPKPRTEDRLLAGSRLYSESENP